MSKILTKWKSAPNYMGEDYSDYYLVATQNRDSDALVRSNFRTALNMLGGESKNVIVARSGHWAVGWIEMLLVHETAKSKIKIAEKIIKDLADYPVLDEQDYYEEQQAEWEADYSTWARDDAIKILGLEEPLTKLDEKRLWYAVGETFAYSGEAYLHEKELISKWQEALQEIT